MEQKGDALSIITNRKSVRKFIPQKPVSHTDLETILKAGMAAPTGRNTQPWVFIAITERAILNKLAEQLPYAKMLVEAGAAIIVCGDMHKAMDGTARQLWITDCSMASQNILLAIEALGLGATYTAVHPDEERVSNVRKFFNLPENIIPLCAIPVGYPAGDEQPKDKWKPENVHWDKWE